MGINEGIKVLLKFNGWFKYETISRECYDSGSVNIAINKPFGFQSHKEAVMIESESSHTIRFNDTGKTNKANYSIFEA